MENFFAGRTPDLNSTPPLGGSVAYQTPPLTPKEERQINGLKKIRNSACCHRQRVFNFLLNAGMVGAHLLGNHKENSEQLGKILLFLDILDKSIIQNFVSQPMVTDKEYECM